MTFRISTAQGQGRIETRESSVSEAVRRSADAATTVSRCGTRRFLGRGMRVRAVLAENLRERPTGIGYREDAH